jgi:NIPSNAP
MFNYASIVFLTSAALLGARFANAQDAQAKKPDKLYELRLYTANEGKLPDLHARFRDHTMRLFEKHGIENIIYWTVSEGAAGDDAKNLLVYIIAHKDQAAATASWAAFQADPEWKTAAAKSEENGKLLAKAPGSVFMKPVDFSPADEPVNGKSNAPARLFELRKYNDGEARVPATVDRFKSWEAALFAKHGMPPLGMWTAADNSAFIYLLAHKDRETSRTAWEGFFTDFRARGGAGAAPRGAGATQPAAARGDGTTQPAVARAGGTTQPAARRGGRAGGGGGAEIRFLIPTDYSPRK